MDMYSVTKTGILNKLSLIPKEMLPDIEKYLDFVTYKKNIRLNEKSLKGIWIDSGFEKINIEKELRKLRLKTTKKLDKIVL